MCSARRAMTLIELLVVISIIAVLATLLLPALATGREMARKAMCGAHIRQLAIAAMAYADDHDDILPPASIGPHQPHIEWKDLIIPYYQQTDKRQRSGSVLHGCPSFRGRFTENGSRILNHPGYGFNPNLKRPNSTHHSYFRENAAGVVNAHARHSRLSAVTYPSNRILFGDSEDSAIQVKRLDTGGDPPSSPLPLAVVGLVWRTQLMHPFVASLTPTPYAAGGDPWRHRRTHGNAVFVDGSVRSVNERQMAAGLYDPANMP